LELVGDPLLWFQYPCRSGWPNSVRFACQVAETTWARLGPHADSATSQRRSQPCINWSLLGMV